MYLYMQGWLSFEGALDEEEHFVLRADNTMGLQRIEVLCRRTRCHLGHKVCVCERERDKVCVCVCACLCVSCVRVVCVSVCVYVCVCVYLCVLRADDLMGLQRVEVCVCDACVWCVSVCVCVCVCACACVCACVACGRLGGAAAR